MQLTQFYKYKFEPQRWKKRKHEGQLMLFCYPHARLINMFDILSPKWWLIKHSLIYSVFSWISLLKGRPADCFSLKLYESRLYHVFTPHLGHATLQFDILCLFEPHFMVKYSINVASFSLQTDPQDFTSDVPHYRISRYFVYCGQKMRECLNKTFISNWFISQMMTVHG